MKVDPYYAFIAGLLAGIAVALVVLVLVSPSPEWVAVETVSGQVIECIDFRGAHFACFEEGTMP